MKNNILFTITISFLLGVISLQAQLPTGFNYQAVARHDDGSLMTNHNIDIRFTIYEGGLQVFQETYSRTTNKYGLFNVVVGESSLTFGAIKWGNAEHTMKVEIDAGNGFQNLGFTTLYGVPYANYALEVANKNDADADPVNEIQNLSINDHVLSIENANNVVLPDNVNDPDPDPWNELQTLSLNGAILNLSHEGGSVILPASGVIGYSNTPVAGFGTSTSKDVAEVTFTLEKESTVLILANVNVWGGGPCEDTFRLEFDGTPENRTAVNVDNQAAVGGNNGASVSTSWMRTFSEGTHTVKFRAWGGCPFYKHPHLHVLVLGN